jgi:hypothetical protein
MIENTKKKFVLLLLKNNFSIFCWSNYFIKIYIVKTKGSINLFLLITSNFIIIHIQY